MRNFSRHSLAAHANFYTPSVHVDPRYLEAFLFCSEEDKS
jgi:hypothetical protein